MAGERVAVAYSGGRDSTALLHATLVEAAHLGIEVVALHVNHGLSPNADAWQRHCETFCRRFEKRGLPITFVGLHLSNAPRPGDSVEAWARQARYQALGAMARAQGAAMVLLAHHRRDQAETFLLQALRGAGVAGLAGMPHTVCRDGITWVRPWLDRPREEVEAYARRHRLGHIEDESNGDERFARNRVRLRVWPGLTGAFAQAEASLAAAAEWSQQASSALAELAEIDLAEVATSRGLTLVKWRLLSLARRSNVLRAWLKAQTGVAAPAALVTRLMLELPNARSVRWLTPGGELRTHRGVLSCAHTSPETPAPAMREATLSVRRAGIHRLPGWAGRLQVLRVARDGVPLAWLAHLELRQRAGAEQFQAGIGRPPRSLKKQFQSAGVPAWEREGPLVYSGGQLVFVPGLGIDARVLGLPGQALVDLRWLPLCDTPHQSGQDVAG